MHRVGKCAISNQAWVLAFIPWPVRNIKAAMWKSSISTHPFSAWNLSWSWDNIICPTYMCLLRIIIGKQAIVMISQTVALISEFLLDMHCLNTSSCTLDVIMTTCSNMGSHNIQTWSGYTIHLKKKYILIHLTDFSDRNVVVSKSHQWMCCRWDRVEDILVEGSWCELKNIKHCMTISLKDYIASVFILVSVSYMFSMWYILVLIKHKY